MTAPDQRTTLAGTKTNPTVRSVVETERMWMARSKTQMTHAKRDRERARLEKRARKQEKKEARKLESSDDSAPTMPPEDERQPQD